MLSKIPAQLFPVLLIISFAFVSSCTKQYLTGYYSKPEFLAACEWKKKINMNYTPEKEWMDSIASLRFKDSVDLRVFLGTYCPDSKRWVPKFFSFSDQLPLRDLEIVSVDTTKKDEKGFAQRTGLRKIPTFVFYQNGNEIGRLVEKPRGKMERRFFDILKRGV